MEPFPFQNRGSYLLYLELQKDQNINIGALGTYLFCAGFYLYSGSALGRGGLRARLKHHLSASSKPNWHIDWLCMVLELKGCIAVLSPYRLECHLMQSFEKTKIFQAVIPGFGSSDCHQKCVSHLLYSDIRPDFPAIVTFLKKDLDGEVKVEFLDRILLMKEIGLKSGN